MKRMSMQVTTKSGIAYDANHLSIEKCFIDGKVYSQLSFLCSGQRTTLMADTVKEISFSVDNATWCSECDNSILGLNP